MASHTSPQASLGRASLSWARLACSQTAGPGLNPRKGNGALAAGPIRHPGLLGSGIPRHYAPNSHAVSPGQSVPPQLCARARARARVRAHARCIVAAYCRILQDTAVYCSILRPAATVDARTCARARAIARVRARVRARTRARARAHARVPTSVRPRPDMHGQPSSPEWLWRSRFSPAPGILSRPPWPGPSRLR